MRISINDLEKMSQKKYVCTEIIRIYDEILGDNKPHDLEVDIFDGFAYTEYKGVDYQFKYPKLDLIKTATNIKDRIKEIMNLGEKDEITETDSLAVYGSLSKCEF